MLYMHPFISTEPGALTTYPASTRLLNAGGYQVCYAGCQYACMWFGQLDPATGKPNAYGEELLRYVDKAIGENGFGGIYMDESIYSTTPENWNPLVWDGVSGYTHETNGSVLGRFTDTTLVWSSLKLLIYDRVKRAGGHMMANCAPVTQEVVSAGVQAGADAPVNFVETGSAINRLRWAQLYTPIGLAKPPVPIPGKPNDSDPRYANVSGWPADNLYASLDFGCLTFMYDRAVPNVTGWRQPLAWINVMRHAFPITPQELGPGFVIGCERVVAKVSGTYAPSTEPAVCAKRPAGRSSLLLCVREFDREGWQRTVRRGVPAPASVELGKASDGLGSFAVVTPDEDCSNH